MKKIHRTFDTESLMKLRLEIWLIGLTLHFQLGMYRISSFFKYPADRILGAGYIEYSIQSTSFCQNTGKLIGENEKNVNNTIDR